jgi:hypothetical protein
LTDTRRITDVSQLSFFTYGTLVEDYGHPRNETFHHYTGRIYEAVATVAGYIWTPEEDWDISPWWKASEGPNDAQTLSVWENLDAVFRFTYRQGDVHAEALKRRKDWFAPHEHPLHVAWWIDHGDRPTWREGVARLEHLDANGSSPHAFTFRQPYAPDGTPVPRPTL